MNTQVNPKYKILVVDDDLDLNTSIALLLEFDGHEVQTAYTGEAALKLLAKSHFDLMISEYWLPLMKGTELAALVRHKCPDLPIIMVTNDVAEINMDEHPITGISCLLDKPFSMDQLREAMRWAMGHNAERQAEDLEIHWVHRGRHAVPDRPQDTASDSDDF